MTYPVRAPSRFRIILASASPDRKKLLHAARVKFSVRPSRIPEKIHPKEGTVRAARRLAREKALAVAKKFGLGRKAPRAGTRNSLPPVLVLGADTLVEFRGEILGKPKNKNDAKRWLTAFSGHTHRVVTGICVVNARSGRNITASADSRVKFRKLDDDDIERYLKTGEWKNRAGAYAIQGRGKKLVARLRGAGKTRGKDVRDNVIGLPVRLTLRLVKLAERKN